MKWLRDYFDLSRREETGLWTMIVLLAILFATQYIWIYLVPERETDFNEINQWTKKYNQARDSLQSALQKSNSSTRPVFDFDPNSLDKAGFIKLGISDIVANHIIHYREKGGIFHNPDDFRKIYGLNEGDFQRLNSHIRISQQLSAQKTGSIDLNTADSVQLLTVRGIGPVFASRILSMRKGLGAFIKKEQLKDVYGIDAEKYEGIQGQVMISPKAVRKFNINTCSLEQLRENPYLKRNLASAIINYRNEHGLFQSTEDVKKIYAINEELFQKLSPYLKVK